jgi:hypothetical protein
MQIPHVRVEMPDGYYGRLMSAHGCKIFITLPGQKEHEWTWVKEVNYHMNLTDPNSITLEILATLEVHDVKNSKR